MTDAARGPALPCLPAIGPRYRGEASRFVVDRGTMFRGITLVAVPVLSPAWEPLLILTGAGRSHDLEAETLEPLCRAMQSAVARLSESVRLLRLE